MNKDNQDPDIDLDDLPLPIAEPDPMLQKLKAIAAATFKGLDRGSLRRINSYSVGVTIEYRGTSLTTAFFDNHIEACPEEVLKEKLTQMARKMGAIMFTRDEE